MFTYSYHLYEEPNIYYINIYETVKNNNIMALTDNYK